MDIKLFTCRQTTMERLKFRCLQNKTYVCLGIIVLCLMMTKHFPRNTYVADSEKKSTEILTIQEFHSYIHNDRRLNSVTDKTTSTLKEEKRAEFTNILVPVDEHYYKKYFKYKNLDEFCNTLTDLSKSSVTILNNDNYSFKVGDIISVSIKLYNIYGDKIQNGGDFLKIWMRESSKNAGSAGYVIDHGNGSYTGFLRALWSGSPVIKISLSFPKEAIGLFVNNLIKSGMVFNIDGVFKNSYGKTDLGICGIHQHIGDNACNFTSLNYDMKWYCNLPETKEFVCDDWYGPRSTKETAFTDKELNFVRSNSNRLFETIPIVVSGENVEEDEPDVSCRKIGSFITWTKLSPVGFFHRNKWQSRLCKDNLPYSEKSYGRCLRNREIYLIGDSSLRVWFVSMVKMFGLNITVGPEELLHGYVWHQLAKAEGKSSQTGNISITWMPHELPFLTSSSTAHFDHFKPPSFYLEKIKSKQPIIIIHWYLHFSFTLTSVFREHVQNAKRAIVKFLKRVPDAKIFIKGPHNIDIKRNQGIPHDFVRYYQEDILFKEFSDINNRTLYLNEWDVTLASESKETHPTENINRQMIHNFLTLIC